MLSRRILRDNFQNVGSGFVQRLFHCGLQGEGRRRTTAAGTVQLEPNDAITHADQLAVSAMRLEIGPDGLETRAPPWFLYRRGAGSGAGTCRRQDYLRAPSSAPVRPPLFPGTCRSAVAVRRRAAQPQTAPTPAQRPEPPGRLPGRVWLPAFLRARFERGILRAAVRRSVAPRLAAIIRAPPPRTWVSVLLRSPCRLRRTYELRRAGMDRSCEPCA